MAANGRADGLIEARRANSDERVIYAMQAPFSPHIDKQGIRCFDAERILVWLDERINAQVNLILQNTEFIALECSWRGLNLMVRSLAGVKKVKLKLLHVNWAEITHDCNRCDFEQTHLFELIYNQEFSMPGGEPYGLVIGDYIIGPNQLETDDTETVLGVIGAIAMASFCPFVAGAAPSVLGLTSFDELNRLPELYQHIGQERYMRWNNLRRRDTSRFLGLVAPHILLRNPFQRFNHNRQDGFMFEEAILADGSTLRWGNGCYAFAINVARNFNRNGWFSELRGVDDETLEGGYLGEDILSAYVGADEVDKLLPQPAVELRLTARQQQQFCIAGIIPVATSYLLPGIVFNANQSLFLPENQSSTTVEDNLALSAMLQYVLCVSRFAHCIKLIMRDEIGNNTNRKTLQRRLKDWLLTYTLANSDADADLLARYPLRAANVAVTEVSGRPGIFICSIDLQPHMHLEALHATFRLLIDAPVLAAVETMKTQEHAI